MRQTLMGGGINGIFGPTNPTACNFNCLSRRERSAEMKAKDAQFWLQVRDEINHEIAKLPVPPTSMEVSRLLSNIAKRLRESPEFAAQDNDDTPDIEKSDDKKEG